MGFLVMGYHPGAEDDGIYLTAVKADLNPALFPHDAAFFQLQMRTSTFDTWMAHFVQGTGIPLAWSELLWQALSIILILWACWSIVCQLFEEATARWAGLAMVAAMFTLPVAGTALFIVDQYLHPRSGNGAGPVWRLPDHGREALAGDTAGYYWVRAAPANGDPGHLFLLRTDADDL
jgi:hypothetical protein